jgi:hypothetical protein
MSNTPSEKECRKPTSSSGWVVSDLRVELGAGLLTPCEDSILKLVRKGELV